MVVEAGMFHTGLTSSSFEPPLWGSLAYETASKPSSTHTKHGSSHQRIEPIAPADQATGNEGLEPKNDIRVIESSATAAGQVWAPTAHA